MTLIELLNVWTVRYGLTWQERLDLGHELARAIDFPTKHPAMPSDLASKLGVRTYRDAVTMFLTERLASPTVTEPAVVPIIVEPEPAPVIAMAPNQHVRKRAQQRCSICRELGHRLDTCPRIRRGKTSATG